MISADKINILLTSKDEKVNINNKEYYSWRGYLTYEDKPVAEVSGLESVHPFMGQNGPMPPVILLSENVSKKEKQALAEKGKKPDRYGKIKLVKKEKDGKEFTQANLTQCSVEMLDLSFPMFGFVNSKDGVNKISLSYSERDRQYFEGEGKQWFLDHGHVPPEYKIESVNDLTGLLEHTEEIFPYFNKWKEEHFTYSEPFGGTEVDKREFIKAQEDEIPF